MFGSFVVVVLWGVIAVEAGPSNLCSVTGLQTLFYLPGHTYAYTYEGKSEVTMEGVKDARVDLDWRAEVDLSWVNSCDVILVLRDPVVMGKKDESVTALFSKFPVVATMSEGVVQGVAAHPDESPEALNFKKGIIASLQNSLPSISLIHSGKTYPEIDVVGMCPTHYTVKVEGSKYIVTKFKNHNDCSQRMSKSAESLLNQIALKSPLPLTSSASTCVQKIQDGVIISVVCEDSKEIRPTFTSSKFVKTKQISELSFRNKSILHNFDTPLAGFRVTDLLFDDHPQPQLKRYAVQVFKVLEDLCRETKNGVSKIAPKLTSHLITLLNKVPLEDFEQIYRDIKTHKICPNSVHIKTIFLDIIAFVEQEEALKLMVQLITEEELTGLRTSLYILSLFLRNNLSEKSMTYLLPAFMSPTAPPGLLLAAGHLVSKYCQHKADCFSTQPVAEIFNILSSTLAETCQQPKLNNEERVKLLGALKTVGNMVTQKPNLEAEVIKCIRSSNMESIIRVTALQSFRLKKCSEKVSNQILNFVLSPNETTEVRLEAYMQVIRCPTVDSVKKIVSHLESEENLDVASFILSDLRNIAQNQFPTSQRLQKILSQIILPERFCLTSSQNLNIGYFSKPLGIGIDTNTNLITDWKNNFRKYDINFLLGMFNNILKFGEISSRMDNTRQFFSSKENSNGDMGSREIFSYEDLKHMLKSLVISSIKKNNINISSPRGITKQFKEKPTKSEWDAFLRLFETEIFYVSIANEADEPDSSDDDFEQIFETLIGSFELSEANTTRAIYAESKIIIPTAQGIPVLIKCEITTLFGVNIFINSTRPFAEVKPLDDDVISTPQFSSEYQSFIGFGYGAKVGIRNRIDINLSTDVKTNMIKTGAQKLRFHLEKSKTALETWTFSSHVYLFRKLPNQDDIEIVPASFKDPRLTKYSCLPPTLHFFGFKTCWKLNVSNVISSEIFPFGDPSTINFFFETENPKVNAIQIDATYNITAHLKSLSLEHGSENQPASTREKIDITLSSSTNEQTIEVLTSGKDESSSRVIRLEFQGKSTKFGTRKIFSIFADRSKLLTSHDMVFYMSYGRESGQKEETSAVDFELKTLNKLAVLLNAKIKVTASLLFKRDQDGVTPRRLKKPEPLKTLLGQSKNPFHKPFLRIPLNKSLGIHFKDSLTHQTVRESLFWLPVNFTVHKLEVELGSGDFQTSSSLRKVSSDQRASEYRFLTTLEAGKALGGARVVGGIGFRGLLDGSIVITSKFTGNFEDSHVYQISSDFNDSTGKTTFSCSLENISNQIKLAFVRYSKVRESSAINTEGEVIIPQYIPHYKVVGSIVEVEKGEYKVSYTLKKEGIQIFKIEGPVTVILNDKEAIEEADLYLTGPKDGPYHVAVGYSLTPTKNRVILNVKRAGKQMFLTKIYSNFLTDQLFTVNYQVLIPQVLEINVETKKKSKLLETVYEIIIFPNSTSDRTIKGEGMINYETKDIKGIFFSGSNADYSEYKAIINAHYDLSVIRRFFLIRGDIESTPGKFSYDAQLNLGSPNDKDNLKHLLINVTKHKKEYFLFEVLHHDKVFSVNSGDVTDVIKLTSLDGKSFKFEGNYCYIYGTDSNDFQTAGQFNMSYPGAQNINVKIESESRTLSSFSSPEKTKLAMQNSSNSSHPKTSDSRLSYKDMKLRIETIFSSKKLRNITLQIEKKASTSEMTAKILKNSVCFICFELKENQTLEVLKLFTSSKVLGISAKAISSENALNLFPNREWSTAGHVLGGKYFQGAKFIYENLAIRSSLKNLKAVNALTGIVRNQSVEFNSLIVPQTSVLGEVEFAWPKEGVSEKISVSLETIEVAKGSNKTELIFRAPIFASMPRILVETSFTPLVKSVTISFQQDADKPSTITVSGTFSSPTKFQSNFYGFIKTPKREIEFTSSITEAKKYLPLPQVGFAFNGTVRTSGYGLYDFTSSFCPPAYFEFEATKRGQLSTYLGRFGLQEKFAIIGIDERKVAPSADVCPESLTFEKKVSIASASLLSSTLLHFEFFYNISKLKDVSKSLNEGAVIVSSLTKSVINDIWTEMIGDTNTSSSLVKHLTDTLREIKIAISDIHKEFKNEIWFPNISNWLKKALHFLESFLDTYKRFFSYLKKVFVESFEHIFEDLLKVFDEVDHAARSFLQTFIKYVQQVKKSVETLKTDWDIIEALLKYLRPSNVWKFMKEFWNFVFEHLDTEISIFKQLLTVYTETIEEEINCLWKIFLGLHPSLQNIISDIKNWIYGDGGTPSNIIKKIVDFYITKNEGAVEVKLPLRTPVHSIKSAVSNIGLPEHITSDYFGGILISPNIWQALRQKKWTNSD